MNNYCQTCNKNCEEIFPTFKCDKQMNIDNKEKLAADLKGFRDTFNMIKENLDFLIERVDNYEPEKIKEIVYSQVDVSNMSFKERGALYEKNFGLGQIGPSINEKLILISLMCTAILAMRKQDQNVTVLDCVKRLTDYEDLAMNDKSGEIGRYYESLAIICESFLYGVTEGNAFGLKTGAEIKIKIKEILDKRLPF